MKAITIEVVVEVGVGIQTAMDVKVGVGVESVVKV